MGAYIKFRLEDSSEAMAVNDWLLSMPKNLELREFHRAIVFWDEYDEGAERKKFEEKGYGVPNTFNIGDGDVKVSGMGAEEDEIVLPKIAEVFKEVHKYFNVKVYSGSCGLRRDYFTPQQLRWITDDGEALSGDDKESVYKEMYMVVV